VGAHAERKTRAIDARGQVYAYYARVIRDGGWIGLQYWYFYRYNDWRTSFEGVNDHEGDWEAITIYLYQDEDGTVRPRWAVLSCHDFTGNDLRRRWDDAEQLELIGEHPVAYVGAGSHAHYYRPGEYLIEAEVPPLKRLAGLIQSVRGFWAKAVRKGTAGGPTVRSVLAIPFVEYARGDGVSLGPGQAYGASTPAIRWGARTRRPARCSTAMARRAAPGMTPWPMPGSTCSCLRRPRRSG
jgi:hypothetical protein